MFIDRSDPINHKKGEKFTKIMFTYIYIYKKNSLYMWFVYIIVIP